MSKTIEISLTQSSIRDAIRELENYKREINFKLEEFIRRLAEEGVVVAKQQIMAFPAVDSGELLNSIEFEKGDVIVYEASMLIEAKCAMTEKAMLYQMELRTMYTQVVNMQVL